MLQMILFLCSSHFYALFLWRFIYRSKVILICTPWTSLTNMRDFFEVEALLTHQDVETLIVESELSLHIYGNKLGELLINHPVSICICRTLF